MKRILFLALVLCLHLSSTAQKIKEQINYDTITYVFKLDAEQSRWIIKSGRIHDTDFLFTKLYKEYPRKTFKEDTLPEGNYLVANVNDHNVYYKYIVHTPFLLSSKVLKNEVFLYLSDKKNKELIRDIKLDMNGTLIPYDSGCGGFSFLKKKISAEDIAKNNVFLHIAYKGEEYVMQYNIQENPEVPPANRYYDSYGQIINSPGYLLLDKPLYKPLDTLHLKSYLVDFFSGRPIRKRVRLSISESAQDFNYSKTLRRKSAGAYLFQWAIPDSLKTDRLFNITLKYGKRGRTLQQNGSFKLEQYELNKNTYDMNMPESTFYSGDDVFFYVSAKDMNGFPAQGTKVHYQLRLIDIQNLLKDTLLLSNEKRNKWYEADTTIEYDNMIKCVIPSSQLAKANARYYLDVTFTDPISFEKKSLSKEFYKLSQTEKLLMYQEEDTVRVRCLYNGKDTAREYNFYTMRGNDTLQRKKIKTPFHYPLQPFETMAAVVNKERKVTAIQIQYNKLSMVHVKGKRTGDSIRIQFQYPFPEPVYYRIYKKEKLMKSGSSSTLDFAVPDATQDEWRIQFTTNLQEGIENNFYEMTFVPEKNLLHVDKTIPAQAFPGDSVAVELKVMDYKSRPMKKINVAAYALNRAFEENIQTPVIQVPEEYENRIRINPLASKGYATFNIPTLNANYELKNDHFIRFNLKKNEYYKFLYPDHEYELLTYSKQQQQPEFAIFIHHKQNLVAPKYILLDGKPVFLSDVNRRTVYSLAATSGKHEIAFRYFNRLYTLKNIEFKQNTKYMLGVNIDSIQLKHSAFVISDSLPVLEPHADEKKRLYSSFILTNVFSFDSLNVISKNINENKRYNPNIQPEIMNIDGDPYFVLGPFTSDTIVELAVNGKHFAMKCGVETTYHYDQIIHDFVPKKSGAPKGEFLPFVERAVSIYEVNYLLQPDTIVPPPINTNLQHHEEVKEIQEKLAKEEQYFYQNYRCSLGGPVFNVWIENNNDTCYVKSLWMVSKTKFEAADFIAEVPRQIHQMSKYLAGETYDIYFLLNKNRIYVMRDQKFNANDELYVNPCLLVKNDFHQEMIEVPLKIYAELNSVPLLPFHDEPWQAKETIKRKSATRNNIYFHGMITSDSQQPLPGALVYVEMNGVFKYGAVTNGNGLFEIMDMLPATYQVKVYHPDFKVSHIQQYFMEDDAEYELMTMLVPREASYPTFETVTNDFRMMAYTPHDKENYLRMVVHDKENRQQLKGVQVLLSDSSGVVKRFNMENYVMDFLFPENEFREYTMEISKPGYTSLILHQVYFRNLYHYDLEVFLGLEKKEILKNKSYNVNLDQVQRMEREVSTGSNNVIIYDKGYSEAGEIYGRITDEKNQPLDFASVQVLENGIVKGGGKSDLNGLYKIKPLKPGTYKVKVSYVGFQEIMITDVTLFGNMRLEVNLKMMPSTMKANVVVVSGRKLVDNRTIEKKQLSHMATVNTEEMLSEMPSVYQRREGDQSLNISGSQSNAPMYYAAPSYNATADYATAATFADNLTINAGASYNWSAINGIIQVESSRPAYADESMIQQVIENTNVSTIRKSFSDVGFWKPNMVTNKAGKVGFKIKLPDNITSWKAYYVFMGKRWRHGIDSSLLKVYKPLQTVTTIPNYFYKGDECEVKSKFMNLTSGVKTISTYASINKKDVWNKTLKIENTYVDSTRVKALTMDSVLFESGLVYEKTYKDAEQYTIPVFSPAMVYYNNQSVLMDHDSTYILQFNEGTKGEVIFNNQLMEKILAVINELQDYEYGCVEQTTSKINALLLKSSIQRAIKLTPNQDKGINLLLARLSDMQNNDGSFGWWKNSGVSDRMTIYAMEIAVKALRQGYTNNVYVYASNYVKQHFKDLSISDQLYAFYVLKSNGDVPDNIADAYARIKSDGLNTTDKMYYVQTLRMTYPDSVKETDVYALFLEMNQNCIRPYQDNFFYDYRADLFKAYTLFKGSSFEKQFVQLFRKKLLNGQLESNLNTFSKVAMIEAMTTQAISDTAKPIYSFLTINDSIQVKTYPYRLPIQGTSCKVKHTGGDVFMNTSEKQESENPSIHDSIFALRNYFTQNNEQRAMSQIMSGKECTYNIDLTCFKKGQHVMIEIPIPSGMKVKNKITTYSKGNYIEYFKHKVVYYFEELPMGTHPIQISLMPVFKGSYTLAPAKCSLMYYPYVYGNTKAMRVEIQ